MSRRGGLRYDREGELVLDTPVARITIRGTPLGITHISFVGMGRTDRQVESESSPGSRWKRAVYTWFDVYFSSDNVTFSPLLRPAGTDFQRDVWEEMRSIPPGETRTYGAVAEAIGRTEAARAVGQACGGNPIPILVPCHRVIPAGNGIGGYSGPDGVKRQLLEHESQKFHRDDRRRQSKKRGINRG